jgi:uncharacterized membrane protein
VPSPLPVPSAPGDKVPGVTQRNIDAIAQLEQEFSRQRTPLDRVSDGITAFVGSVQFVIAHAALILAWVLVNFALPERGAFDPYPFTFLNLLLGVETVFLSTFVLMSQNRQNHQADRWAHLDLQVSLLAEQETTKMLQMLRQISDHLGLKQVARDKELREMVQTTHVEVLVEELDQARESAEEEAKEETAEQAQERQAASEAKAEAKAEAKEAKAEAKRDAKKEAKEPGQGKNG